MDTQPWDYWERRDQAQGARRRDRLGPRDGAEAQSLPCRRHPPLHPCGGSLEQAREGAAAAVASPHSCPARPHRAHAGAHLLPPRDVSRVARREQACHGRGRALLQDLALRSALQGRLLPAQHPLRDGVGADGRRRPTAIEAASKLDASIPAEVAKQFAIMEPVKAAPYTTHAHFSDSKAILALPAPAQGLLLVKAMHHYARAVAPPWTRTPRRQAEIAVLEKMEATADFKAFAEYVPAKEMIQTARLVAAAGIADGAGTWRPRPRPTKRRSDRGHARLHGAAVLVLPGAPVAGLRAPAPGPARRGGEGLPRFARARAQQRLGPRRARRGLQAQGHAKADAATRADARAWFGPKAGPDLARSERPRLRSRSIAVDASIGREGDRLDLVAVRVEEKAP